jgi:hypothetical protein
MSEAPVVYGKATITTSPLPNPWHAADHDPAVADSLSLRRRGGRMLVCVSGVERWRERAADVGHRFAAVVVWSARLGIAIGVPPVENAAAVRVPAAFGFQAAEKVGTMNVCVTRVGVISSACLRRTHDRRE